jgi:hypothetical protein
MFVNARYAVWMTDDEFEVLRRAMATIREQLENGPGGKILDSALAQGNVRRASREGRDGSQIVGSHVPRDRPERTIPDYVCLEALLDEFLRSYDELSRSMREAYPLFERDGWRCSVPGCSAYGPLHLHHITFRSHGGGDEPENLTTQCAFHHRALHDGWIRCVGRAPHTLYWELGTDRRDGLREAPVARIAGHRRLADDEYWDGARVRRIAGDRSGDGAGVGRVAGDRSGDGARLGRVAADRSGPRSAL